MFTKERETSNTPEPHPPNCMHRPQGPSTGSGNSAVYNFNFAVSGARVEDMPQQATTLVSGLKESLGERYPTAWKMVTLLIGGNNLCDVCIASKERDNDDVVYEKNLRVALETLKEIPNVVVNVVLNMDYTQLAPLVRQFGCLLLMPSVCPCLGVDNEERLAISREYIRKYNDVLVTLVAEFNRKVEGTNTRFVVQPFAVRTALATSELISKVCHTQPSSCPTFGHLADLKWLAIHDFSVPGGLLPSISGRAGIRWPRALDQLVRAGGPEARRGV